MSVKDFENKEELIEYLKSKLRKKAVVFETGGFRPTHKLGESWIGNVCWQKPGETQPMCSNVPAPMAALATIFVPESDFAPKALKNIKLITIFIDDAFWDNLDAEDLNKYFVIRTYENLEGLVPCDYSDEEMMLSFPLKPRNEDNEFPNWDDLSVINRKLFENIFQLENENILEYYADISEGNASLHKLGGYPSSIQGEVRFKEGCEFVMQISSDSKADINIVDNGNLYFGYNPQTKEWSVKCDFY